MHRRPPRLSMACAALERGLAAGGAAAASPAVDQAMRLGDSDPRPAPRPVVRRLP